MNQKLNVINVIIKYYYNKFYKCANGKNLCPLCAEIYKSEFYIIDYDYRFNICYKHTNEYISYCNNCNINLCEKCEIEHKMHKIICLKQIKLSKKRIEEIKNERTRTKERKKELEILNNYTNNIINGLKNDLDKYIIIYNYFIECSKYMNNYESIKNILNSKNSLNLKNILKDINYILNENNIIDKHKKIINIYENKRNEMTIIYKIKDEKKIFGESFVKNNKGKCYLIINNKKYDLCEEYPLDYNEKEGNIIIKLIEIKKMENMSYMFHKCSHYYLYLIFQIGIQLMLKI